MKQIFIFLSNFLFYNQYLNFEQNRNYDIVLKNLNNLVSDFEKISFPFKLTFNYTFISIIISILLTILIHFSSSKNRNEDLIAYVKQFVSYFFINCGVLFTVLYILRFYNFSRGLLFLNILLYPIYISFINFLQNKNNILFISLLIALLIFNVLFFVFVNNDNSLNIELNKDEDIPKSENIVGFLYENSGICNEWVGSSNFEDCIIGSKFTVIDSLNKRASNLLLNNKNLFVLTSVGEIYVYSYEESGYEKDLFLDLSDKVFYDQEFFESGLFSMAFHPSENYFLVSYSNVENSLTIDKYFYKDLQVDKQSSEQLLSIPSDNCCHYSGNIIWSEFFKTFLISVGDMGHKFNSTDTTSPKGKILLLEGSPFSELTPLISDEITKIPLTNIVAFGLRNPWKTYEYKNLLFIPDIGFNDVEELNVVNLEQTVAPPFLGWPLYEGNLDREERFYPLFYFENNNQINLKTYAQQYSVAPSVYYRHNTESVYRGALIGGGVIKDSESKYFENYIFADYISKELFAYDYKENLLTLLPLPGEFNSYISSLIINSNRSNSVLMTTGDGDVIEVELP